MIKVAFCDDDSAVLKDLQAFLTVTEPSAITKSNVQPLEVPWN